MGDVNFVLLSPWWLPKYKRKQKVIYWQHQNSSILQQSGQTYFRSNISSVKIVEKIDKGASEMKSINK